MFQTKVAGKIKTQILCLISFPENGAIYEIMWENIVQQEKSQMTIKYGACALHAV